MIDHAGRGMGVMVLDSPERKLLLRCPFHGISCREIVRMEIMDEGLGFEAEQLFINPDGCLKVFQGLKVFHVSHVLAQERIPVTGQAEGVLQFCAARQDGRRLKGELDRVRCVSPGTTDGLGFRRRSHALAALRLKDPDAVVITRVDLPIMEEKPIREMSKTPPGFFIALSNGFFR
jgi:hypothetical protein